MSDVRCPTCRKLLGREIQPGAVEVRVSGRIRIVMTGGFLTCVRCSVTIGVGVGDKDRRQVLEEAVRL